MRIVIVGSVAAGTSAATKARRNSETAEIVIYDRGAHISYSACGIPYFIGGEVDDVAELEPRDPAWFASRHNIDIRIRHEVTSVDPAARTVRVTDLDTGRARTEGWDALVLATGASPIRPDVPGIEAAGVFTVRTMEDACAIRDCIDTCAVTRAVLVGAGYIGLEMADQLAARGIATTLVERAGQVMGSLDEDMAHRVGQVLSDHGVGLRLESTISAIVGDPVEAVVLDTGERLDTDLVIIAVGVRPNTALAHSAGVALGTSGAIAVDERMATNVPGIWAVGDVAETRSSITGKALWHPQGSTANRMGRIAGDAITGGDLIDHGILGTGIFRVFDTTVAQTGLTERAATEHGYDTVVLHTMKADRPAYLDGRQILIKSIADRGTGRVLGAQIIGDRGVDKRIDVLATAISLGARASDLVGLDLAYAPPFAPAKDPVHYTGMALVNALRDPEPPITPAQLDALLLTGAPVQVVDVRSAVQFEASHVAGAIHIPLGQLRSRAHELDASLPTVTYCTRGVAGNTAQHILRGLGFPRVRALSGGSTNYLVHQALNTSDTGLASTEDPGKGRTWASSA